MQHNSSRKMEWKIEYKDDCGAVGFFAKPSAIKASGGKITFINPSDNPIENDNHKKEETHSKSETSSVVKEDVVDPCSSKLGEERRVLVNRQSSGAFDLEVVRSDEEISGIFVNEVLRDASNIVLKAGDMLLERAADDNPDIPQIQLISDSKDNTVVDNTKSTAEVLLTQTLPEDLPSEFKVEEPAKEDIMDNTERRTAGSQDLDDVVLTIREQDEPSEPMLDELQPVCKIEGNVQGDNQGLELDYENVLSLLEKSTDEEICKSTATPYQDEDSIEKEDEYEDLDDNSKRLATKYGDLGGELILLNLPNPRLSKCTLGFKLSGNKDLNTMSVFICQIIPNSLADIDGRLRVGDEILEIDDHIIFGRSHLNATPIIKSCSQRLIKFVIHRSIDWLSNMAIPVTYRSLEECHSNASSRRSSILDYLNDSKDNSQSRKTSCISLGQIPTYVPSISTEEAHIIYLKKGTQGFGFAIMEGSFTNEEGIFIKHLAPSGPAAQDGSIRPGDKLISINNQDISTATYDTALELLKSSKGQVRLVVTRVRCAHSPTHSVSSPVKTFHKRLSAPHITALPMLNRPISPTIYEEKPEPHSQGISIITIPESESGLTTLAKTMTDLNARRRSSLSNLPSAGVVTLIMNHLAEDENVEVVTIKRDKQPLGMSIIGGSDTFIGDVIVHDIFCNGVIASDGRIRVGDRIIMINDDSVNDRTNEEVLTMLQSSCPIITLKIRHPNTPIQDQDIYEVVTTIELVKKPSKGLGISVIGREGAKGVYICDIVKGGVADVDSRLQPGDQILEINGDDFRNSSQEETATTLKWLMGPIIFKIGRIQRMNLHYTPTYLVAKDDNGDHGKHLGKRMMPNGPGHSPSRSAMASPAHAR